MPRLKGNEAILNRLYNMGEHGTMTLKRWLETHPPDRKTIYHRYYSRKRVRLAYVRLSKPAVERTLWTDDSGVGVPKALYDQFDVPETVSHEPH